MPSTNFTDRMIAGLKPSGNRIEWFDEKTVGLCIRVSPQGTKTWFVRYRLAGKRVRLRLGRYPDLSLESARQKARQIRVDLDGGDDPARKKREKLTATEEVHRKTKTFTQLARQYLEEYAKQRKRSWKEDERLINKVLRPVLGPLYVNEIKRSDVRACLRQVAAKTPVQANRAHACLRKIFNWAIREEVVDLEGNPAAMLSSPGGKEMPRDRVLSDQEIKQVWKELEQEPNPLKRCLQLILLTGQRPGEVAGVALSELNLNEALWTIPRERAKNGMASLVPLSSVALRVIQKQEEDVAAQKERRAQKGQRTNESQYLFPSRHIMKEKPMTIYGIDQEAQRIWQAIDIPRFSPHDLRRTASTKLGEMGVPGHVIDRILNHKPAGITERVYNRYDYLREKREALEVLGAKVLRIASDIRLVGASPTES